MNLAEYIDLQSVIDPDVSTKARALQLAAATAGKFLAVPADAIFDALYKREKLGSTGIGEGVAIPHTRILEITKSTGLLLRLKTPIDFESIDNRPVDIIFVLLTSEQEQSQHLNILACVARRLRSPKVLERMRAADGAQALYDCFIADT